MEIQVKNGENIWFYVGGSIGVTLLGIHALETARRSSKGLENQYFLIYTHESNIYEELVSQYPHINLLRLSWNNIPTVFVVMVRALFRINYFIYPPSFGHAPLMVRILSRLVSGMRPGGRVFAWLSDSSQRNRIWYTCISKLDLEKNIFYSVASLFAVDEQRPSLLFSYDISLERLTPKKYIVFHPFAASEKRTYPDTLSKKLLTYLIENYPDHTIVLSAGPKDTSRAKTLVNDLDTQKDQIVLLNDLSLGDFKKEVQIISSAGLYVGIDTGITHVAAHLNVPMVVLGNLSNPMWLPTYSPSATVLFNTAHCTCTLDKKGDCKTLVDGRYYYRCMVEISWQSLRSAIELRLHG